MYGRSIHKNLSDTWKKKLPPRGATHVYTQSLPFLCGQGPPSIHNASLELQCTQQMASKWVAQFKQGAGM